MEHTPLSNALHNLPALGTWDSISASLLEAILKSNITQDPKNVKDVARDFARGKGPSISKQGLDLSINKQAKTHLVQFQL